ncbi:hypothetical protein [Andreprevotia chitinilytica]|uniref:hypothetical protein n=1 Tax=Andreprevotia chitinilytica TaxID=396808 RepID=UPI000557740A|nr:hypothetical protein [Andreprevotia chitinilytica]
MAAEKPKKRVTFSMADTHIHYDRHAEVSAPPLHVAKVTTAAVHRFGALPDPKNKPNRIGQDFLVDVNSRQVTSTHQKGASLALDPVRAVPKGKYTTLPKGSSIPLDMELRDDGDAHGHVSLFNKTPMSYDTYEQRMATIATKFVPGGTKK